MVTSQNRGDKSKPYAAGAPASRHARSRSTRRRRGSNPGLVSRTLEGSVDADQLQQAEAAHAVAGMDSLLDVVNGPRRQPPQVIDGRAVGDLAGHVERATEVPILLPQLQRHAVDADFVRDDAVLLSRQPKHDGGRLLMTAW